MEVNFNGNNRLTNMQMGDGNTMNISGSMQGSGSTIYNISGNLSDADWYELKSAVNKESRKRRIGEEDAHAMLECAEKRDVQGLRKILSGDSKNFLLNVLGSSVSTGLFMALEKICGL